jgi:hypothetical protein
MIILADGRARKDLTEEEPYLYPHFGYRGIEGGRVGVSTPELARSRNGKKNLWIDLKGDSSREAERADLARREYRTSL